MNSGKQAKNKTEYSPLFKEFYEAYPKKTAPDTAWKAFQAIPLQHHAIVVERAKQHADAWRREDKDPKYIKHPATWLNSGCWKVVIDKKTGLKDCAICGEPYGVGHKFAMIKSKKVYKCPRCNWDDHKII